MKKWKAIAILLFIFGFYWLVGGLAVTYYMMASAPQGSDLTFVIALGVAIWLVPSALILYGGYRSLRKSRITPRPRPIIRQPPTKIPTSIPTSHIAVPVPAPASVPAYQPQLAPARMKSLCVECGQKMTITSKGVFFMGSGEPNVVKLRCERCNITRFEKKADMERELGRTLPREFTLTPQQYELPEVPKQPEAPPVKLQKPDTYFEDCFSLPYEEIHDDRKFGDVPEMLEVAKLGNAGKVDEALRLAGSVLLGHPDLDNVYYWLGHLNNSKGMYEKAKEVLLDGIPKSKRKYSLYRLLGDTEYQAGKLSEAVKWWTRSIVSQLSIKEKRDYNPFLYLAYVCEAMGLGVIAPKLFDEVDTIRSGKVRLVPSAQTNIHRLVRTQGIESMRRVLEELCARLSREEPAASLTVPVPPPPEAPKLPEAEWEKRYRFLSFNFGKRSECSFMDLSGKCVSPEASYPITSCTCSRGYQFCHVYPVLIEKLPIWKAEYENRMRMEARMEGSVGECRICGNNRKLDRDHMCSVCLLAINRANEVFEEKKEDSLICDWCMKEIQKGEAFLPVTRGYLCCVDCWKRIYAND